MKKYIKIFILLCIICWTTNNAFAVHRDTIIRVDQEHHSISAPDAVTHQWYYNGEKIQGQTKRNFQINQTGTYKVEITNTLGEKTEIESSFLVTAAGAIIKIYIIGDSTVCNYNANAYPQAGWGQIIPSFFNTTNLSFTNNAIGGRSSRSFFEEGRWTPIKNALNLGDYVFIQWGHNDRDYSKAERYTSVADYKTYLTMYCNDTKAKGAIPVLISPMVMNAWTGNTMRNVFTENGNNYRGAMLEVATALNVAFVDLNMKSWNLYKTYGNAYNQRFIFKGFVAGEYPNYPNGITDGTHFQEMGAIANARMVVEGIGELSARADMANLIANIKPQYTISIAVNPAGADILTTKNATYPQGLTITLKTLPKTTSTFQKWNNAGGTQISTATLTTVTSGISATSFTAMYVGATNSCTSTITSSSTAICGTGTILLTANAGASYKWFNGTTQVGTASTYTAATAGNYTVEVTNATGCKVTSAIKTITVNPLPVITQYAKVDAGAWLNTTTASTCEGSTLNLGPQPNLAAGWAWTGPNNFTSTLRDPILTNLVVASSGNYIATYTDANGCKATSTFTLQVSKPVATISSSATSFCTGSSVVLTASAGASYKWFNGTTQVGTAATYTARTAGDYTVEVTNTGGCKNTSAIKTITIPPLPVIIPYSKIDAGAWASVNTASACEGNTLNLGPQPTTNTGWSWTGPNNFTSALRDPILTNLVLANAGNYIATYTDPNGCIATSNFALQVSKSTAIITTPATSICAGASTELTSSTGASYKWFNGTSQVGTAATYTANTAGAYTVEVTNAAGCKATSAIKQITTTATPIWYADTDNDGMGDISNTLNACIKPSGYVATAGDACPTDASKTAAGNCGCGNTEASCLDCNNTPNGTAVLDNCSICVDGTTGRIACVTTATSNGASMNIQVAPQPFNANTTITVDNLGMIQSFTIISTAGAIVEIKQGLSTDAITIGESISSGLYTVIITTEKGVYTTKIVKK